MEVSVMGKAQGNLHVRTEFANRESKLFCCSPRSNTDDKILFCRRNNNRNSVSFLSNNWRWRKLQLRFSSKAEAANAVHSQHLRSHKAPSRRSSGTPKSPDGVRLFVGLPLDTVSDSKTVKHARAIAAGLKALKLLGVDGVELPVWWGVAEKEAMGKYDWSAYLAVTEMVKEIGLKLHVLLCFHASKQPKISLPDWVCRIGESDSSIYHADRAGRQFKECLSLAVYDLPVLDGKTPIQVYSKFCESFKSTFKPFMGSTITGITMGLGPDGELRYPSHHQQSKSNSVPAAGEFQCWDPNMLSLLKQHAEATGNPLWGLGGPHDAPRYDESPTSGGFFMDHGGSWDSPYGDFFLSWYSSQLISHGNRLLSLASSTFSKAGVGVYGKVPLIHLWYKTRSHSSELTAGFYNTDNRDGYSAVAEMFAKNSCKMILTGMDLADEHQPRNSLSSPELLLAQIRAACREHGVGVSGQNSSESGVPGGFEQIKKYLLGENVELFTYQRMGAYFFSPEHFPAFSEFVRNLSQPELHSDDSPVEEKEITESGRTNADMSIHVQAA